MPRARINGIDTYYEVHDQGQPLLFIHGGYGGAGATIVPQLLPEIVNIMPGNQVQTVIYDRRNSGRSEYTLSHFTNADLAEDACSLLDHLGIDRAIICGSSAG